MSTSRFKDFPVFVPRDEELNFCRFKCIGTIILIELVINSGLMSKSAVTESFSTKHTFTIHWSVG